jgi:hypothetical protein
MANRASFDGHEHGALLLGRLYGAFANEPSYVRQDLRIGEVETLWDVP